MAFTIKLFSLIFMAAMCFFLLAMEPQSNDSKMVYEQKSMAGEIIKSRKVQWVELSSANSGKENDGKKKEKMAEWEWELREAPMGPDPLHHHGGSPISRSRKQPATTP